MKTIAIKLPEQLLNGIESTARKRGESRSALVRQALREFLAGQMQPKNGSCLDLARDLAGRLEGREDLSVNPDHMDGYGR